MSDPTRQPELSGQSLVEFALVFPIFLLLLFGLIDIGRYVYTANALNQAAREGARYGSVASWSATCAGSRESCIERETVARLAGVQTDTSDVVITCRRMRASGLAVAPVADCRSNDLLSVDLKADFQILTPIIGQFIGATRLEGYAEVTVSQ